MAAYADILYLKSQLGISDANDDALLQRALNAASLWIRRYTGRSFEAETAATKVFYPGNSRYIDLSPDIRTLTTIEVDVNGDGTYTDDFAASDYLLLPLNPEPDAGIYSRVEIASLSGKSFPSRRRVRILGDWGYVVGGVAPEDVQQACLMQAARLFKRVKEAPFGVLQTTDLGQFTRIASMDPDVKALLDPYKASTKVWIVA